MALKNGFRPGGDNEDFFHNVDWSRTQAYALGLGGIFLNRKGREEQGIIPESEVGTVESALVKGLTGLPDPERGKVAVRSVARREQIYSGPYADESPDLVVNFSEGYRVSWGTPLGGVPEGIFEDNVKKWGGDHVIDPALVPGVLFMSQPFHRENPDLVDLAPTILSALGVPQTSGMEGESLLS
jgi:predicted AlkP superfamily phosphohydrolase/phosphomutase